MTNEMRNLMQAKAEAITGLANSLLAKIDDNEIMDISQVRAFATTWREAVTALVPAESKVRHPRAWNEGDPEPEVGTVVMDRDGDVRYRIAAGKRGWSHTRNGEPSLDWESVATFAPLTEVIN